MASDNLLTEPKGRAETGKRQGPNGRYAVTSPLGERLRAERDRLGLSLRELARRLEVSPSLVSQIETGKIQPSVRTLYAMVSELGVSLDDLFAPEDTAASAVIEPSLQHEAPLPVERVVPAHGEQGAHAEQGRVQRATDRRVIELEAGVHWERLTTWNDREVDFLYTVYEPEGASSPAGKLVRHNGREFGTVLSGRLGVTVGFEEHVLGPGDSISFESTIPHRLHNDGDVAVTAIWVVVGRHHDPQP